MICKMPFDLYKIYNSVRRLGGFVTVSLLMYFVVVCYNMMVFLSLSYLDFNSSLSNLCTVHVQV